jgi:choline-sulfatase
MDALDATGLGDNTVVIYYSDHGETFFYRDDGGHKFVCFDEAILVPVILHWPSRLAAGRVVSEPVGLQDLVPTVLDCAGAPLPATLHGRSILPLARGERVEWRDYALSRISRTSESGCSAAIAPSTGS